MSSEEQTFGQVWVQPSQPDSWDAAHSDLRVGSLWSDTVGGVWVCTALVPTIVFSALSGGVGSVAWGSITGTLSSQTDLQTALNAKARTGVYGRYDVGLNLDTDLGYESVAHVRERVRSARTYYVSATGDDLYSGLTTGQAFRTWQHAVDVVSSSLDLSADVTIQGVNGDESVLGTLTLKPLVGTGRVTLNLGSGEFYTITTQAGRTVAGYYLKGTPYLHKLTIDDHSVVFLSGSAGVVSGPYSFSAPAGGATGANVTVRGGGKLSVRGTMTVYTGDTSFLYAYTTGVIDLGGDTAGVAITLSGSPAFSRALMEVTSGGAIVGPAATAPFSVSFVGSVASGTKAYIIGDDRSFITGKGLS